MIICSKCGHPNEGQTAYCRVCAALLGPDSQQKRTSVRGTHRDSYSDTVYSPPKAHSWIVEQGFLPFWRRHWPKLFLLGAVMGCVAAYGYFWTIDRRLNFRGHRFTVFSLDSDNRFFVGIQQNVKGWSESSNGLDTRFLADESLETGVLTLHRSDDLNQIEIRPESWIRQEQTLDGARSISIPVKDPSLASIRVSIGPKDQVDDRPSLQSSRTGRALPLIFPRWPERSVGRGDAWQEKIEWLDSIAPWVFEWKGSVRWQLIGYETCGNSHCARFSYQAAITPKLFNVPPWAATGLAPMAHFTGYAKGHAVFDVVTHGLVENTFIYEGIVRIPFSDLQLLPKSLRTLELHQRTPGSLVFHINEKVSVTRP